MFYSTYRIQKMNLNVALPVPFMLSHFNENRSGGAMILVPDPTTLKLK